MAAWSSFALKNIAKLNLVRSILSFKNGPKAKVLNDVPVRNSHDRTMVIRDSTFEFKKVKDLIILYLLVGMIPLGAIILYTHIFIGPATLALIPEGYEPKPWEYHKNPVTRFFATFVTSPQERHERNLHCIFNNEESKKLHELEVKVKNLIKNRGDYQSWYYVKPSVKYARIAAEEKPYEVEAKGTALGWLK